MHEVVGEGRGRQRQSMTRREEKGEEQLDHQERETLETQRPSSSVLLLHHQM
jgi:hypothetical protein